MKTIGFIIAFSIMAAFSTQTKAQPQTQKKSGTFDEIAAVFAAYDRQFMELKGDFLYEDEEVTAYYSTFNHDKASFAMISVLSDMVIYTIRYDLADVSADDIADIMADYIYFAEAMKEHGGLTENVEQKYSDVDYIGFRTKDENDVAMYDFLVSDNDVLVNYYYFK